MTLLHKTLSEMPNVFTSNEFNKKAVTNGYSKTQLQKKGLGTWLKKYCDNMYGGSKTWVKKEFKDKKHKPDLYSSDNKISEEQLINYLKSKGYKVMKPVNEWVEC
jgi:hypothetical protein